MDIHTYGTNRHTPMGQTDRQTPTGYGTDRQTHIWDRQTETDRQKHTYIQTDRQTDRQTDIHTVVLITSIHTYITIQT